MTRLKVGVIGLGAIAQIHHLPNLQRLADRFEIVNVCDLSPTLAKTIADRYDVPRQTTDWQQLCDDDALDAVLVLSSGAHGPQARRALENGRHVLAEKPLCYTVREADELEALARDAGRVLQVGYMKVHEAVMPDARAAVERLGDIRLVRHWVYHPSETAQQQHLALLRFRDADPDLLARARLQEDALVREAIGEAPPGLLWLYRELALGSIVHYLSVLRSLFDKLPATILHAYAWPFDLGTPPAGWSSDDQLPTLSVFAEFDDICRLELTWAWLQHYPEYTEQIDVLSPDGAVQVRLPPPYVHHRSAQLTVDRLNDRHPQRTTVSGAYEVAFVRELEEFHASVTNGAPVRSTAAHAGDDTRWCQQLVNIAAAAYGVALAGEATSGPEAASFAPA